jgi:hypothetical protein
MPKGKSLLIPLLQRGKRKGGFFVGDLGTEWQQRLTGGVIIYVKELARC